MKRFLQSFAGSFVGRFAAVLVIAALTAVGLGPNQWAAWLFGIPINSALIARCALLLAAAVILCLLLISVVMNRASGLRDLRQTRRGPLGRAWKRVRISFKILARRAGRFWFLFGPSNYEIPHDIVAIGRPYYPAYRESRIEFSKRFSDAFPGTRDLLILDDSNEIIHRLDVLLRWPLIAWARDHESGAAPFYWTSGRGHMHIYRYCRYKKRTVLINAMEIKPRYLAAIPGLPYWQNYVYLESEPLPWLSLRGEEQFAPGPYQEYAIYNGKLFNRREYDDGGYMLRGKPVRFSHDPDIRSRRTVPFGFLIIAKSSPANRPEIDTYIERLIDSVIADKKNLGQFAQFLLSLPKGRDIDDAPPPQQASPG